MRLYSALFGLSLIWGLSFVFIMYLTSSVGVWGTVFFRCIAGVIILLPFLWLKRNQVVRPIPWKSLVVIGVFNAGLPWGLISLSETQINSNAAAVLNALTPIFTGLIGFILFSKKLSKQQWLGIVTGFIGILVLTEFNIHWLSGQSFIGIGTMMLATLCYGFASQYTKKYLSNTSVLLLSTSSLIVGAIIGLLGMIFTNTVPTNMHFNFVIYLSIIGLGCLGSGIAYLLFYYLLTKGSPEFAATVTYIIPLTAMIWGYVLLDEPITKNLLLGLLIIFLGIYFSNRNSTKKLTPIKLLKRKA
ncbi:DMT family transporter [Bacillus sp. 03113]|uniref:DMT family transporter n=1 Tax=Bacillus sp. 03113 TaxID=2578211 RepID=UPI001144A778|nr:EamA family transporter [Bacillus sp. 03113]